MEQLYLHLKKPLYDAFKHNLNDDFYSKKGYKKYRIFLYIAIFGCVHVNDLYVLFPSDYEDALYKNNNEIYNVWTTRLNYLSYKKKGLEKLKQPGYFTLNNEGIHILYEHLQIKGYFSEVSFKQFYNLVKINKSFVSHSSKSGRISVNYLKNYDYPFCCEPIFDVYGKLRLCSPTELNGLFFSPDTFFYDKKNNENIFIEADSSQENINSQILFKLNKYKDYYLKDENACLNTTIHFSIWNEKDNDLPFTKNHSLLYEIRTLYELISGSHKEEYSFLEFIKYLYDYSGNYEVAKNISLLLKETDAAAISSFEELELSLFKETMKTFYNKHFLLRRTNLYTLLEKNMRFSDCLVYGLRFICTPLNSHDHCFKYVYIENANIHNLQNSLINYLNLKGHFLEYFKTKKFDDISTGFSITFRNVFLYRHNINNFYIILENYCDDLGGNFRINYYNKNMFFRFDEKIHIVAIRNSSFSKTSTSSILNAKNKNLHFIDYDDFDKLSSG